MSRLSRCLAALEGNDALSALRHGIEKECLRVDPQHGGLSQRPHPAQLGSALTHTRVTTDFAEAQLEFTTGVHASRSGVLNELDEIHRYVYSKVGSELMWPTSMPCIVPRDDLIPVARYGESNAGRTKTVYRIGLGNRYGRLMQTISGLHYNFSLPDELWPVLSGVLDKECTREVRDDLYLDLIRNCRRYAWLLIYLFGASPAVCRSFVRGRQHNLQELSDGTLYLPHATSLRMGPLGYQSEEQTSQFLSFNSLAEFTRDMATALNTPVSRFEEIGICSGNEFRQLSTTLFQTEAELYGIIRPKRVVRPGERLVTALAGQGIEYVELRCLDLNPAIPTGIDESMCLFLDSFLLYCLCADSPPEYEQDSDVNLANQLATVHQGRDPDLRLKSGSRQIPIHEWATDVLNEIRLVAETLDSATSDASHQRSVDEQFEKVEDVSRTPSAQIVSELVEREIDFFVYAMGLAGRHRDYFNSRPLASDVSDRLDRIAAESVIQQEKVESSETKSFTEHLDELRNVRLEE